MTTRRYIAVRCAHLDPSISSLHCTARKDMVIDASVAGVIATNDASIELKAGDEFYLVRSDSLVDEDGERTMFYIVRVITGHKRCSCAARKPCRHEIAAQAKADRRLAELRARDTDGIVVIGLDGQRVPFPYGSSLSKTVWGTLPPKVVTGRRTARLTDVLKKRDADAAPLNGNRGFSLMR